MMEYVDHKGILLNRYEWFGGFSIRDKNVLKEQTSRRREVRREAAIIVNRSYWE